MLCEIFAKDEENPQRMCSETAGELRKLECVVDLTHELASIGMWTNAEKRLSLQAGEGVTLIDLFIRLEFAKSKSEVRRLVKGGGARLNGEKVEDAELVVSAATFEGDAKELKLSSGKKKHGLVVLA